MEIQSPIVVEVTRGHGDQDGSTQYVESSHQVDAVVCDPTGKVVQAWGEIDRMVFPRSAIKALQALPLIESGAADDFGFSQKQIALACSSHNGEPVQTKEVGAMLRQAWLSPQCLECGAQLPYHPKDHEALVRSGKPVSALHNNCSGKHAGFVAFAAKAGLPTQGYIHFGHPVQTEIAGVLEEVTGAHHGKDNYGIDGCSIPTYEIPLKKLAAAFACLGAGEDRGRERAKAMRRIRDACLAHPEMVAGTKRFDTDFMQAMGKRVFTKTGAEGVYTIAIPELGFGAALKCHDGTTRAAEVACAFVVESMFKKSDSELSEPQAKSLKRLANPILRNWNGFPVGQVRVAS